jgi:flavorubredoxin
MNAITANDLSSITMDLAGPTTLYAANDHRIFWLGITDETAFRCNAYLILDRHEAILVDPGSRQYFPQVRQRVEQIIPPQDVSGMVLCHQDPDVAASMVDWLDVNPSMRVFTSPRTQVLLPHYGRSGYQYYDVTEKPVYALPSGAALKFVESPFLHFPGAFVTYDTQARYLFSGDIWAALDLDWSLTVSSFEKHAPKMDLFHLDYMSSNLAARGFLKRIENLRIDAIGTDVIYADLGG